MGLALYLCAGFCVGLVHVVIMTYLRMHSERWVWNLVDPDDYGFDILMALFSAALWPLLAMAILILIPIGITAVCYYYIRQFIRAGKWGRIEV